MFFLRFSVLLLFLLTFSLLYSPMFSSIFFFYFFVSHLSNCPLFLSLYSLPVLFPCFFCPSSLVFFFLWFQKQSLHFKPSLVSFPMFSQTMLFPFLSMSHFYNLLFSFLFFFSFQKPLFLVYICAKIPPSISSSPPVFIGSRGRGPPYPVQAQGKEVWGGFCTAAPGHGSLLFSLSCWQGMVGMGGVSEGLS